MSNFDYGSPTLRTSNGAKSAALRNVQALQEEYQAGNSINILSEDGLSQIISDPTLFADYSSRLAEGADEPTLAALTILSENTRRELLTESMISGVNPITALSLPMLRVTYPKIAVREGLPTEPVEQPSFKVPTKRPYIIDKKTGEKAYLPQALKTHGEQFGLPQLSNDVIALTSGQVKDFDLLKPISKTWRDGNAVDVDFAISTVVKGGTEYSVDFALNPNLNVVRGEVEGATILATVDREKGLLTVMSTDPAVTGVRVTGYVSSEMNNDTTAVGFDITSEEINIPTGQPIESPINIQQMTDVMAMYRIDSTMSHLEIMSTVLAQSIDKKGVAHIERVYQKDPSVFETWNVKPPVNYIQGETQWREELKICFDRVVTALQDRTHFYSGHAVVFAHPMDALVLSNVRWVYQQGEQQNNVSVDYKLGTFTSGVTSYTLLQSPHFQRGKFKIVFIPSDADLRSTMYIPYSFNTIRGAASPNTPNVPAIQMIQRSVYHTFTPTVAEIRLTNFDVDKKDFGNLASVKAEYAGKTAEEIAELDKKEAEAAAKPKAEGVASGSEVTVG